MENMFLACKITVTRIMSFFIPELPEFEKLQDRLQNALGDEFVVEVDADITKAFGLIHEHFDLAIFLEREPIAGIEYKSLVHSVGLLHNQDWLTENFKKVGVKYGILYFGKEDEFYLYIKGHYGLEKYSFDGIVQVIGGNREFGDKPLIDEVCAGILSCKSEELNDSLNAEQLQLFNTLFTEQSLCFDEERGVVSFYSMFEDRLFQNLLPQEQYNNLCRYTSLDSLFKLMDGRKHCMCSITCMNDKGETSYADSYISYGAIGPSYLSVDENNNCFILSCCNIDIADDLTMWRLYADNGKGACIKYKVDTKKVDGNIFFLAPVSYGQKEKIHYELDFIRNIRNWRKNGWRFELKRWYIWKHFFKSYLFAAEKEVRLLFAPQNDTKEDIKWILDSKNHIASRLCMFSIKDDRFPLKLEASLIGPKCPEQSSNVDQFNYMNMKQCVFPATKWNGAIKPSKIRDYR